MKDGLLRKHRMVLNRPAPAAQFEPGPQAPDLAYHNCSCGRWGSFSFDAGRTWFCAQHKPEQRP